VVTAVALRPFDARSAHSRGGSLWDSDAAALEHVPVLCNERDKDERAEEEQRNWAGGERAPETSPGLLSVFVVLAGS
jgi:hypothetical protein